MWAITCIVVRSGAPSQELSYFYKDQIPEGSIISIPLRGKDAFGLVLACEPATDLKQTIRSNAFELRKLSSPKPHLLHSRAFLRALFEVSMTQASAPGALIASFTPTAILARRSALPELSLESEAPKTGYEPLLFYNTHNERVSEYKRLVRESLARGVSILILTPTIAEAEILADTLSSGIKEYVEIVHGDLGQKKTLDTWKRIALSEHPLVIVGTTLALSVPRSDIAVIVLEREGSASYRKSERPYAQGKLAAEALARQLGARFILSSTTPSIDSMFRKVQGDIQDIGLSATRLTGIEPTTYDLREYKKEKGTWDPLLPPLISALEESLAQKKPVLILAARRGLAPMTVCDDCGEILTCSKCTTTLVLHKEQGRRFLCHHCGHEEPASIRCNKCGGWRLTTLGIAIDRVAESLEKHFPTTPLFIVTSDLKQKVSDRKIVERWQEQGGILLATERIMSTLPDEISCVAIASIDSLVSIPEYTASERAFTLLCELRSRATELFLVQTRDPSARAMRALREGSNASFVKDELENRKRFGYPPYTTLIRFTSSGKKESVEKELSQVKKALEHLNPQAIAGKPGKRGETRGHILVRLPQGTWVDQRLLRFIRTLPPSLEVRVNPLSIHTD